jgi:hypothetical protein
MAKKSLPGSIGFIGRIRQELKFFSLRKVVNEDKVQEVKP